MKLKKIISVLIVFAVIILTYIPIYAQNTEYVWYVKRAGNKRPQLDKEQEIIYKYNACYIDRTLTDESDVKKLYLTFDLGYVNDNTIKILNVLREENIPSAFFILDNVILKNTDIIQSLTDDGHIVCNHTKNHKNLSNSSKEEIAENLSRLEKLYEEKTGKVMSKYFRFPEGKYSEEALSAVCNLGYKTVFWSFAYDDWDNGRQPNPKKAIKKVLDNTHNGAIILLHPTSRTNAEILPYLIKEWRRMGYSFDTLDNLG